jgi:hypothetical protein
MTPMNQIAPMTPAATAPAARPTLLARLLVLPIEGYRRLISPFLGQRCRFTPSCSAYAVDALRVHGAARGLWLAVRRVARCHPWNPGGSDPIPPRAPVSSGLTTGVPRCTS